MSVVETIPLLVIDAFHLMWGNYPEPASLVHRTHEVIAVNKAYDNLGILKPGMNYTQLGTAENHRGCLASKCIKEQKAKYTYMGSGQKVLAFWLPVDGYPDLYIHFGVGNRIDYEAEFIAAKLKKESIKIQPR